MEEIWKDIPNYEGKYQVSNLGNVKSLKTNKNIYYSKSGNYYRVGLFDKKRKMYSIHRLVAEAFLPNKDNKPCVNHKDTNTFNNKLENLEWCTYKQNNNHNNHELKRKITNVINEIKKYDNNEKVINVLNSYYNNL